MRRLRTDLPYTFRPPKMSGWLRPLARLVNARVHLARKFQIAKIEESGLAEVARLCTAGNGVLLAPNHSDHADPHVVIEAAARHGLGPYFMGAREVFEASPTAAWALQHMGVFSVDRDGPDLAAIKTAMGLLAEAREPLVIFPEGEIYHHHRKLDPLNEGVASILLKAASKFPAGRKAYLVPVAMRYGHDSSVEQTFADRLARLEGRIGWLPKPHMPVDDRIRRLAAGVLATKETEFLGFANQGTVQERLAALCEALLVRAEEACGKDARANTPPERVRALRYRIRRRLLDEANPPDAGERRGLLDHLDAIFVALQAHSYIGDYLVPEPTLDRRAEMIMKLEEDLFGYPTYPVARYARLTAAPPIDVSAMLASGELPAKGGAAQLTEMLEARLGAML